MQDKLKQPPVKEGDIVKARVKGFGAKNDPFVNVGNYIIFLKDVPEGQLEFDQGVEIKITRVLSSFGFGELI